MESSQREEEPRTKKKKKHKKKKKKKAVFDIEGAEPSAEVDNLEIGLLRLRECFAYRLKKRQGTQALLAAHWGLGSPMWTGNLRLTIQKGVLRLKLENITGTVFAQSSPLDLRLVGNAKGQRPLDAWLEPVQDSQRYFVIMVQDPSGKRKLQMGVGFRDRGSAYSLKFAISDELDVIKRDREASLKQQKREEKRAAKLAAGDTEPSTDEEAEEHLDLTLHGMIRIESNALKTGKKRDKKTPPTLCGVLLPPPPPEPDLLALDCTEQQVEVAEDFGNRVFEFDDDWTDVAADLTAVADCGDDDEWGDFTSG